MTDNDSLAKRLISRRAELNMSQNELAKASGVASAQISRYESGNSAPRASVIAKLAKGLMVDFSWLAYGEDGEDEKDFADGSGQVKVSLSPAALGKFKHLAEESGMTLNEYILSALLESLKNKPVLDDK
ncbi:MULTISPECIES: helix-turn-helix domain-containing protein [Serratia]|uniref:Helix-turn-helix transcriptional regulator n=1 Tax=Serratia marcescens TaxID=615 RepID=A0ABD5ID27_SERMA|nr:helix-turn-helix transcriptional regulator [Serratia marcescens]MBH3004148.1 helix-turn-helix transcriptional regulator [Serratia marcescens]MDP8635165.1 helix-turn-helix transcriptional regulator [Serratia marcescens]MDP8868665.1 helix-turn-helix transcriptional regulator [Serratia marcescens]MDX7081892.1 helix-turn-helix transcriptional regulator [Serratia marcescens]